MDPVDPFECTNALPTGVVYSRSTSQAPERRRKTAMCDFSRRFSLNLIQQQQQSQKSGDSNDLSNSETRYSLPSSPTADKRDGRFSISTSDEDDVFESNSFRPIESPILTSGTGNEFEASHFSCGHPAALIADKASANFSRLEEQTQVS